jgi:hypothetical protein
MRPVPVTGVAEGVWCPAWYEKERAGVGGDGRGSERELVVAVDHVEGFVVSVVYVLGCASRAGLGDLLVEGQ